MLPPEHLQYLKDLFEGRASVAFNVWFRANERQLSECLPRAAFLRLKFKNLQEAELLLREAGVEFVESPLAKHERYCATLHLSVCDERGRPRPELRRKLYSGAFGAHADGQIGRARDLLVASLRSILHGSIDTRADDLADLAFTGEIELHLGDAALGRLILEIVAAIETDDDLLDGPIRTARTLLQASASDLGS